MKSIKSFVILEGIVDNIGLPISGINLSYSNSATVGPEDADILVEFKPDHDPIDKYIHQLRARLTTKMPGVNFAFLPADIVNQILNFGLPAPINIQVVGFSPDNVKFTFKLLDAIKHIPGIVDARVRQSFNYPELYVDVDRSLSRRIC
jgi:Cu/Ag efflux pump CusA